MNTEKIEKELYDEYRGALEGFYNSTNQLQKSYCDGASRGLEKALALIGYDDEDFMRIQELARENVQGNGKRIGPVFWVLEGEKKNE